MNFYIDKINLINYYIHRINLWENIVNNENQLLKLFRKLDAKSKENVVFLLQGMLLSKKYPEKKEKNTDKID